MISFPFLRRPRERFWVPTHQNLGEKVPGAPTAKGKRNEQTPKEPVSAPSFRQPPKEPPSYKVSNIRYKDCHPLWRVRGCTECNTQPKSECNTQPKSLKRACCSGRTLPTPISGPSFSSYSSKKEESSGDLALIAIGAGKVLHHVDVRQESDKSFSAACPKTPPKRRCSTDAYPRKTSSQGHRNAMTMPSPHQRIAIAQQSQQHPKSGKDLLTRASQSNPLNQGCARMSLAPPFRLPSRRDRSAVSSPDIRSRAVPENVD